MNQRENFLRILRFDQPERVVCDLPVYTLTYRGHDHQGLDNDGDDQPAGSRWVDIWGTEWHKIQPDVMGLPSRYPLDKVENLKGYQWPNPDDERICGQIYQRAAQFPGSDQFLGASHRDTLWEKAYMLVGMENLMIYFHTEPNFVRQVLHQIMDFQLGIARHYLNLGIEFVQMGDDLGTQNGPLLGPRLVNEFLVPEYRRLFTVYQQRGIPIWFHSCGNLDSTLETFLELGVSVLNPVQATANDLERVRAKTQGRLALHGGISSAIILEGPSERIVQEVRYRLWQLGRQGGYLCAPDQGMPYPKEHLAALYWAVEQYGWYPIQPPPPQLR